MRLQFAEMHGGYADSQALIKQPNVGRQFLIILIIIKLILLKIRVRNEEFQIYEWQRATASGVFHKRVTDSDVFP
jgi:hypothetical protein